MSDLVVRGMTRDEFDAYRRRSASMYAAEHVRAGDWHPDQALELAEKETDELLPDGVETSGVVLLVGERAGQVVGIVWAGPAPRQRPGWWIYDIEVVPAERGRGYGRALLEAAEREIRRLGGNTVGLNVFGGNDTARGLYESSGYEITSALMRKRLTAG
ncbi:MAG: GNAT family N-acetyltransferase [Actinomycetota bacterium]|nr:GNAT family N-acetyltransferase [Actinomycetota bacterium]